MTLLPVRLAEDIILSVGSSLKIGGEGGLESGGEEKGVGVVL